MHWRDLLGANTVPKKLFEVLFVLTVLQQFYNNKSTIHGGLLPLLLFYCSFNVEGISCSKSKFFICLSVTGLLKIWNCHKTNLLWQRYIGPNAVQWYLWSTWSLERTNLFQMFLQRSVHDFSDGLPQSDINKHWISFYQKQVHSSPETLHTLVPDIKEKKAMCNSLVPT